MVRRRPVLLSVVLSMAMVFGMGTWAWASGKDSTAVFAEPVAEATQTAQEDEPVEETPVEQETATPASDHSCGDTGDYQEEVEEFLAALGEYGDVFIDGEQSKEDCKAIKKFQKRMGIQPAEGYAGELTRNVAERLVESDLAACDPGGQLVVCIDLTHQTLWVTSVGEIVYGPTVVRTGMAGGYKTQTGKLTITNKNVSEWSKPYKVWLPYWQHFYMGQGLHETTTYIHDSFGSHGCVNLLHEDAVALFDMLDVGDVMHIFGNRPGT
ncbi:MAG TPA: L,D-transpeptidase family protein [Candidatus Stackebrandtia excrementipullorum]|nr:L,D-transpeptidase family protein [Candidatus Stackebrandtia excrementipullorum]